MTKDNASLNRSYAAFGRVLEGMDIVDQISNLEVITRDESAESGIDQPVNPPVITKITVETFGINYGIPETLDVFNYNQWLIDTYGLDPSMFDTTELLEE